MTDEHPIQKYSNAVKELNQARTEIQQMQQFIGEVSHCLQKPYEFMVSNIKVGFPMEVAFAEGIPNLDANKWPTAQQIAEAISNLHQKYKQAQDAYHALSQADRGIVNPLPDKK